MKYFKNTSLLILCILLLQSCRNSKSEVVTRASDFKTIDASRKPARELPLSNLASSLSYVYLESSEMSLLGDITKIDVTDSSIVILDKVSASVFCFDREGKFRFKLTPGKGKVGEFKEATDFTTDQKSNHLYVLSEEDETIFKFELLTGKFIDFINLNGEFSALQFLNADSLLLLRASYTHREDDYFDKSAVSLFDTKGRYLKGWLDQVITKNTEFGAIFHTSNSSNNTVAVTRIGNDTVYTFDQEMKLKSNYAVDFKSDSINRPALHNVITIKQAQEVIESGSSIVRPFITSRFFAFNYSQDKRIKLFWYDKALKKGSEVLLKNDLDGFPLHSFLDYFDESKIIIHFDPNLINMMYNSRLKTAKPGENLKLNEVQKKLTSISNPLLVIINLKKN